MIFEHTITVDAPPGAVTAFLADVPSVAACVPGVEGVTLVGDDEYEGRLRVRLGPVGFSLSGQAQVHATTPGRCTHAAGDATGASARAWTPSSRRASSRWVQVIASCA